MPRAWLSPSSSVRDSSSGPVSRRGSPGVPGEPASPALSLLLGGASSQPCQALFSPRPFFVFGGRSLTPFFHGQVRLLKLSMHSVILAFLVPAAGETGSGDRRGQLSPHRLAWDSGARGSLSAFLPQLGLSGFAGKVPPQLVLT